MEGATSGPGCRLDGGYHGPVCVETVVGTPTPCYGVQGGADNNPIGKRTINLLHIYICYMSFITYPISRDIFSLVAQTTNTLDGSGVVV